MASSPTVIDTIESIYNIGAEPEPWLAAICRSAAPWYAQGKGVMAWTFSMRPQDLHIGTPVVVDGEPSFKELPSRYLATMGQDVNRSAYSVGPVTTGAEAFPDGAFAQLCPPGIEDFLATLGISPDGRGAMLGAPATSRIEVRSRTRHFAERIAAHLANAHRLREALRLGELAGSTPDDAEAVLEPAGKVIDARGLARNAAARDALRDAAKAIDRARASQRTLAPQEAVDSWRALVSGQWSLVDHFESDGRRYVVALRNPPEVTDPRALTTRERHVAAYSALGYSGKQVAYALGIDPSAVSRHLRSGLRKLGLTGVGELAAYFARLVLRAGLEEGHDG